MAYVEVEGKEGIKATIVADSTSTTYNKRITSFVLDYPRIIHSELMTHRLFSRNAASSRAIPIIKKIKMIWKNPAMPVHWGVNQSGMQANEEHTSRRIKVLRALWRGASKVACVSAFALYKMGLHKQLTNRILEPFERYRVLVSATEYDNWFWLRNHPDAQPEIQEVAKVMHQAIKQSKPQFLKPGEWHLPFVNSYRDIDGNLYYCTKTGNPLLLEEAKKVSSSCSAQISFRRENDKLSVAESIYNKLVESEPVHASPFEHQATPMSDQDYEEWNGAGPCEGLTHMDKDGDLWSGNFKGWIQFRQLIPNNACWEYSEDGDY